MTAAPEPVAVVGMAVTLPGAGDLGTYWHNISTGVDAISEAPEGRWGNGQDRPRGGFVDGMADFDSAAFGIAPADVAGGEPDQFIALRTAAAALADAGGTLPQDRARVGIVLGRGGYLTPGLARLDQRVRTSAQLVSTLREVMPGLGEKRLDSLRTAFLDALGPHRPDTALGLVPNLAASRIANRLDLRGPAYTVDAACASSLVAVDHAVTELRRGRCDVMLAGGTHHCHDITLWSVFADLKALSPTQRIRPFHRDADGMLLAEGTGIVVLKRLADARRAGDRVYALVRGVGVAADGRASSLVAPDPAGQARAVRLAWAEAGLDPAAPDALGLLEAHGTGTSRGDAAELAVLADVFGLPDRGPDAVVGSVKSMIGHAMPAAGAASLVKAALAIHHRILPPTLHCELPHPALAATRFRPLAAARPWEAEVRRAGVNAFGFGGINAHVVLEELPVPAPVRTRRATVATAREPVLRLAADTPRALAALLDTDDAALRACSVRGSGPARLAVAGPGAKQLALARRAVARGRLWGGRGDVWFVPEPLLGAGGGRTAFLFPGVEAGFAPQVEDVARHFGWAHVPVPQEGDGSLAGHGKALVDVGVLLTVALHRLGIRPDAVAGHSIGEWAAMGVAGVFDVDEPGASLTEVFAHRVRLPALPFLLLGAPAARVETELHRFPGVVLSHDDAPHQCVVCGPADLVDALAGRMRDEGVLGRVLPFTSGFHTPMLAPHLGPVRETVSRMTVRPGRIPVWSATTAAPFPDDAAGIREMFLRHLLEPVRFRELTEALYAAGFRAFVQAGTGQLPALVGDTLGRRAHVAVTANSPQRAGLAQLDRVVAALWSAGAEPDFGALGVRGKPLRLGSGAGPVSLAPDVRDRLRAEFARDGGGPASPLRALAGHVPAAAELEALLDETAATAAELFAATERTDQVPGRPGTGSGRAARAAASVPRDGAAAVSPQGVAARPPEKQPESTTGGAPVSVGARSVAPAPRDGADSAYRSGTADRPGAARKQLPVHPARTGPPSVPAAPAVTRTVVDIDPAQQPWLLDHCFFRQRPGWPELADRWPVVPATTIVQFMLDAVAAVDSGRTPVAVYDARFLEWAVAAPPTAVDLTVTAGPHGLYDTRFGRYARARVRTAVNHPEPPAPWACDAPETGPPVSAREMYDRRWMFHGPCFQGVTEITALGERHVRGILTTPDAPGALLDNAGQLLGYWLLARHGLRFTPFPVGIRQLTLHGPHPVPGTRVACHLRVTRTGDTLLEADGQLTRDGRVWAMFHGWQDRHFDLTLATVATCRTPESRTFSTPQPGGWQLLFDHWPDPASLELMMRSQFAGTERDAYARHPLRGRRQWLLGRVAAKDAVRHHLWAHDAGPVFPGEIRVDNAPSGRPVPHGVHGRRLPPLELSLAHCREAAVALARPGGSPAGIGIEEITDRPAVTYEAILAPAERASFERLGGGPEWLARFWTAKEAAAKAEGTGLRGDPHGFLVSAGRPGRADLLDVRAPSGHSYRLRLAPVGNPPGLPPRSYVVAWTEADIGQGPAQKEEQQP
ncbi:beta-ketoacyl synthase N-terminal-like domain-containing protein [Streptomyces gamaensis]|uniref:Beta-ketoacyl synthase N-terminal-like domain-containing protein n=1 Tax=Streptomyces gamaensis TaxID=1763542 RepID=A0ABW0Z6Q9_9ACTN